MSKRSAIQSKIQDLENRLRIWRRAGRLPLTVLGILLGMAVASSLAGLWGSEQGWAAFLLNLGTSLIGAVMTYVLIDLVLGMAQYKETLIRKMGSRVNDVAREAVEELRDEGWLKDGSLQGAKLTGANLECANLEIANLQGTNLAFANLKKGNLFFTNLQRADLTGACLQGAFMLEINLAGANLERANLEGADVSKERLAQSYSLARATLPNGANLSEDNWEVEFEAWRKGQEEQGELEP